MDKTWEETRPTNVRDARIAADTFVFMFIFGVVRQALSSDAFVFSPPDPPLSKVSRNSFLLQCTVSPYLARCKLDGAIQCARTCVGRKRREPTQPEVPEIGTLQQ